jgi:hypothetical protein
MVYDRPRKVLRVVSSSRIKCFRARRNWDLTACIHEHRDLLKCAIFDRSNLNLGKIQINETRIKNNFQSCSFFLIQIIFRCFLIEKK